MEGTKKAGRYGRLYNQLERLLKKSNDLNARMATVTAVLHHKMDCFFWTARIAYGKGVCGAAVSTREVQLVSDVNLFPGHIACDSRSNSEIVVPVHDNNGQITGVLDIDSKEKGSFDLTDKAWLEKIISLLSQP